MECQSRSGKKEIENQHTDNRGQNPAQSVGCNYSGHKYGLKKQKLLLMLQECNEQEAAEILPAIEYLLALIHKRGNSNE